MPAYYESETTFFFPVQGGGGSLLSSMGLGNLFNSGNMNDYAISILQSRTISEEILSKYGARILGDNFYLKAPMSKKIKELNKYVKIEKEENVIKITVVTKEPQLSADVVNYYVKTYQDFTETASLSFSKKYRLYIQKQVD
jgi:hypothetical protein